MSVEQLTILIAADSGDAFFVYVRPCGECRGSGEVTEDGEQVECEECDGDGTTERWPTTDESIKMGIFSVCDYLNGMMTREELAAVVSAEVLAAVPDPGLVQDMLERSGAYVSDD